MSGAAGSPSGCPAPARTCGRSPRRPRAARSAARSRSCSPIAPCAALDWAAEQGIDTVLVPGGDDATPGGDAGRRRAGRCRACRLPADRRAGGALERSTAGSSTSTRRCCRRSPALHAVRDALAAGVAITGVTVHLVDATLDGGPVVCPGGRARCSPTTTRPPCSSGSTPSSTGCCRRRGRAPRRRALGAAGRPPGAVRCDGRRRARAGPAPRAAVGLRQDRSRRARARARRAGLRAREHRAAPPGRCATPACPSPTSPPSPAFPRCSTAASRRSIRASTPACSRTAAVPTIARRSPPPASPRSSSSWSTSTRSPRPRAGPASRSTTSSRRSTSAVRRWSARRPRTTPRSRS